MGIENYYSCATCNKIVAEAARYIVDGSKITVPQKGVNIVKYNNGTVKKVIVK